jgi:hypothetical protein
VRKISDPTIFVQRMSDMKKAVIFFAIVLMPALASANFSITFENTTDDKLVYLFYWLDHPFKTLRPANMAAGELQARKSRGLSSRYKSGKYCVIWRDNDEQMHEILLDVRDDVTRIKVTPQEWLFEKDGI